VPQTRDGGIDAFRFLMAMGVIVGHVLSLLPNPVGQPSCDPQCRSSLS
jgi:peptidoglycan/LPS O-acetylase OafA/YrhL